MIETVQFNGSEYPKFQTEGFASQFAIPFAKHFCKGVGYDIGCNRLEWALPGAIPVDLNFNDGMDAYNLPDKKVDYIYSSHCLEHLDDWVYALDYWTSKIKNGGVLFLYLPHYSQKYWRPWNNRKHKHVLDSGEIVDYLHDNKFSKVLSAGPDMNSSFYVVAEK
jgi:predicted SAM-dependent methyltransferase